jgi:protoheme IX farnesyltransferase
VLGLLLFIWQVPHFLALAWMYREDYARGGFRMLPANDPSGRVTFHVAMLYTLALLPLGPLAALTGLAGWTAAIGIALLGTGFLALCFRLKNERTRASARSVFLASLLYLPLVLGLLVADRGPPSRGAGPVIFGTVANSGTDTEFPAAIGRAGPLPGRKFGIRP